MIDIIIFSGQSNMQGQTEAVLPPDMVEGALEYRLNTDELIPLRHPVGETVGDALLWGAHEGKGSLLPAFCKAYMAEVGRPVVAVHAARGATMISEWLAPSARFDALIAKCRGAIHAAEKIDSIGHVWFVWLQGESDAWAAVAKDDYKAMLCTFRESLLKELPLHGFSIIRVGKFMGDARDIAIIRAQEELCETENFLLLTRLTGVCTNDIPRWINPFAAGHYNNAAMDFIGTAAGAHLGRHAMGLPFDVEDEPYPEVRV